MAPVSKQVERRHRGLLGAGVLGACLVASACGSPAALSDAAPPDATPEPDSTCAMPPGITYVMSAAAISPSDVGADLDGDNEVDNMTGNMPDMIRTSASEALQATLEDGGVIMLMYFVGWDDFPNPTDSDVRLYLLIARDIDEPVNPDNNLTGTGEFRVPDSQFDLDCRLTNGSDQASIVEGQLLARTASWTFPLLVGSGGKASFLDNRLECTFDDSMTNLSCWLAGTLPVCALSSVPFPGEVEGNFLDAIVNDEAIGGSLTIDMDRDGDGFEQIVGDGVTILKCIDGDGEEIQSRDCACHPDIVDGYSYALELSAVPAKVVGVGGK